MAMPILYFTGGCGTIISAEEEYERFRPDSMENLNKLESFRTKRNVIVVVAVCFDTIASISALILGVLALTSVIPMSASASIISGSCLITLSGAITVLWIALAIGHPK